MLGTPDQFTHTQLTPSPVSPHSWEDLQTRVTNVTKSANDAINDKHNTQEHKSCNNWHEESQTHAVNTIHWVVWTLSCVYYCQGENTPGMRPHSCQLYSTMSSGHVTTGEERSWCAEVSVLWGLTRLLVTMAGVSWGLSAMQPRQQTTITIVTANKRPSQGFLWQIIMVIHHHHIESE